MAPQAAPHRRGGTHRVKDADRTNTVYDDYDYKLLKNTCVERGIYVKDMKKVEMAKALAQNDVVKKVAERDAITARVRQQRLLDIEKQKENDRKLKEDAAKKRRRIEKEARRKRDESVSDDTHDEDEIQQMHDMMIEDDDGPAGQALSEESWDSTSTETTFHSTTPTILPECKLRLFEWAYTEMPSPTARFPPSSDFDPNILQSPTSPPARSYVPGKRPLPIPRNIPYAPLKVHTTVSKEKLFLPGQTYPPGVDPDYVPILSIRTRHAARNGIIEGVLQKASIERATAWTDRTQIQGWNARMFFLLPPRNEAKKLPEIYNKWFLENRKLLRVEPRGDGLKVSRVQRHAQRDKNKAKKLVEVLEASEYRPTAVCYLPAYLDYRVDQFEVDRELQNEERTLENLFFIRFPGCDVPHYYFWTRSSEWPDPTMPNPAWTSDMAERETMTNEDAADTFERPRLSQKRLPVALPSVRTTLARVKNPHSQPPLPSCSSSARTLDTVVSLMENELYTYGLTMTLIKYRTRWLAKGKENAWNTFGQLLPLLYPSGTLPAVPPVNAEGTVSIAMKLASIEMLDDGTQSPPLNGNEPWTSDDDTWWDIVDVQHEGHDTDHALAAGQGDTLDDLDRIDPNDLEALYRRGSIPALSLLSTDKCTAWLEHVSPSFLPLTPDSLPSSSSLDEVDKMVREEWESKFLQDTQHGMDVTCPSCLLELGAKNIENQAEHMYSHSALGQANHRRAASIVYQLVAVPQAGGRPSCNIDTAFQSFDAGTEGDCEKTPMFKRRRSCLYINTKHRRASDQTYKPAGTPSTYVPSPYLSTVKHYADDASQATMNSKRRHCYSVNTLECMDDFALDRRSSKISDPICSPPAASQSTSKKRKSDPSNSASVHKKLKRRKIADPTYRASHVSSSEDEDVSPVYEELYVPTVKKRKRIADPTYRDKPASPESLGEVEDVAPRRKKSKKNTHKARPTGVATSTSEHDTPLVILSDEVGFVKETLDVEKVQDVEEVQDVSEVQNMERVSKVPEEQAPGKENEEGKNEEGKNEEGKNEEGKNEEDENEEFVWERDWCIIM